MTRDDDVLANKGGPGLAEVGKRNGEIDFSGSRIAADFKREAPLRRVLEVAFVEGALMIHGEFGITAEKMGQ